MLIITDSSSTSGTQIIGVLKDSNSQFDVPSEPQRVVLYNSQNKQGLALTKVASDPTGMQWSYSEGKVYLGFSLSNGDTVVAYASTPTSTLLRNVPTQAGTLGVDPNSEDPNRRTKLSRLKLSMQTFYHYIESVTIRVSEMFANSGTGVTLEVAPDLDGVPGTFSNEVTVERIAYGTDRYIWLKQTVERGQQVQSGVLHMLEAIYTPIKPPVTVVEYGSFAEWVTRRVPMPWYAPNCLPVARVVVQPDVSPGSMRDPQGAPILYNPLTGECYWYYYSAYTRYIELQFLPMPMTMTRVYANTTGESGIPYTAGRPCLPTVYTTDPLVINIACVFYDPGQSIVQHPTCTAYIASNTLLTSSSTPSALNSAYQGKNVLQYVCPAGVSNYAYPQYKDGVYAFSHPSHASRTVQYIIYEP